MGFSWTNEITTGVTEIKAFDWAELQTKTDYLKDNPSGCGTDNTSVDATADATVDTGDNASVNSGADSGVDSGADSGVDSGDNSSVDSSAVSMQDLVKDNTANNPKDTTIYDFN